MAEDPLGAATEAGSSGGEISGSVMFGAAGAAEIAGAAEGLGGIVRSFTTLARNPIFAGAAGAKMGKQFEYLGSKILELGEKMNSPGIEQFGQMLTKMPWWARAASAAVVSYGMGVYHVSEEMRALNAEHSALSTQKFDSRMFLSWRRDMSYVVQDMRQVQQIFTQLRTYYTGATQQNLQDVVSDIGSLEEYYNLGIGNLIKSLDFELGEGLETTSEMYDFASSLRTAGMEVSEFIPQIIRLQSQYRLVGGDIRETARSLLAFGDVVGSTIGVGGGSFTVSGADVSEFVTELSQIQTGSAGMVQTRGKVGQLALENFRQFDPRVQARLNTFAQNRFQRGFEDLTASQLAKTGLRDMERNTFNALMVSLGKLDMFADDMGYIRWEKILGLPEKFLLLTQAADELDVLETGKFEKISELDRILTGPTTGPDALTVTKRVFGNMLEATQTWFTKPEMRARRDVQRLAKEQPELSDEDLKSLYYNRVEDYKKWGIMLDFVNSLKPYVGLSGGNWNIVVENYSNADIEARVKSQNED